MAKVNFNNVSKCFDDDTKALKQFNLSIKDGEFVVLVGPSGCGKSTVLRLLAGLEEVTEGDIWIGDQLANDLPTQQRNIAMVFQNYALYPHMSVRDNLEFPLKMLQTPTSQKIKKVNDIAEILNLTELLGRKPKQLSGGQRQRVAMGRALVRNPSVFLLDEPLSNLDAKLRAQIRADIAQIQQRLNKTTLYVTHDQVEAMTLGHRVAVMNAGELQQIGTPEELYQQPQNIFVAQFIGSPGMNILSSTVISETDENVAATIGQQQINLTTSKRYNRKNLLPYIKQSIFLGVRPEAFNASDDNKNISIKIKIHSIEYLGHESLIYFHLAEANKNKLLTARVAGQFHHASNNTAIFYIHPDAIYLFNTEGEIIQ